MIQVLAVLSQYEIELFTARGIDGKITALKTRGTSNGGPSPYGYRHSTKDSKLDIDPTEADLTFNNYAKRVILVAKNDADAADWIGKAREEHDRKTAEYGESIARIKTNLAALKRRKRSLTRLKEQSICLRSDQISQDKNLLKEYAHEYIESITLFKPSPLWALVVVRFVDGSERWGTIKNVRYAKKEVKRDGEFKYTMGFSGWFINNYRHTLSYDKTAYIITEKQTEGKKTYTFEEYDAVVQERKQTDFFEPYVLDVRKKYSNSKYQ